MLAGIGINTGYLVTGLIVWAVTQILTGVVTARITCAILKQQTRTITENISILSNTAAGHERQIADLRTDRAECELRSTKRFATRGELIQAMANQNSIGQRFEDKIDSVHSRITTLAEKVSAMAAPAAGSN